MLKIANYRVLLINHDN